MCVTASLREWILLVRYNSTLCTKSVVGKKLSNPTQTFGKVGTAKKGEKKQGVFTWNEGAVMKILFGSIRAQLCSKCMYSKKEEIAKKEACLSLPLLLHLLYGTVQYSTVQFVIYPNASAGQNDLICILKVRHFSSLH